MILLDTPVVVWLTFEPEKLSRRAKEAIRTGRGQGGLAVAAITLFELAWLAENGRVETCYFGNWVTSQPPPRARTRPTLAAKRRVRMLMAAL